MKTLTYPSKEFNRLVAAPFSSQPKNLEKTVAQIIQRVRKDGDRALIHYTQLFDKQKLTQAQLKISAKALPKAAVPHKLAAALKESLKNISRFSAKSLEADWSIKNSHGAKVGERFDPIQRVGIYIPGGSAPLISSALMTIGLARVAGVAEIVVCSPPPISESLLFTFKLCGVKEIYQVGGAQAIAAMAYGTKTIRPVSKIFGPGNAFVTEAKRQVFGQVGIDLLAGPSEVMIIADSSAPANWVAADLLAQAEHGKGSRIFLVTNSRNKAGQIMASLQKQLATLSRRHFIQDILQKTFYTIYVKNIHDAPAIANAIAPEHIQIMANYSKQLAQKIVTAGAIFLGSFSSAALGDYVAGPSHTLPTGGAGKAFSGLRVQDFRRRTSIVEYNSKSLKRALKSLEIIAHAEGLLAHACSAKVRVSRS